MWVGESPRSKDKGSRPFRKLRRIREQRPGILLGGNQSFNKSNLLVREVRTHVYADSNEPVWSK